MTVRLNASGRARAGLGLLSVWAGFAVVGHRRVRERLGWYDELSTVKT